MLRDGISSKHLISGIPKALQKWPTMHKMWKRVVFGLRGFLNFRAGFFSRLTIPVPFGRKPYFNVRLNVRRP